MPTTSPDGRIALKLLAGRFGEGASAAQVADGMVQVWTEIDAALHPVIGHRGMAALYARSLNLSAARRPWLRAVEAGAPAAIELHTLHAALAGQAAAEALAGGLAVLHEFHALLAGLVGDPLTDRLLRPVWAHTSGAAPAQDTPS